MKLDFSKAFDTVSWEFEFQVLQLVNFDKRWITWIKALFEFSKILVLVNGVRGLKHAYMCLLPPSTNGPF